MAASRWERTDFNYTHSAQLGSVWGTLQVLPLGATSWDGTSARSTCSWSVASASMSWTFQWGSGVFPVQYPVVHRAGVVVAEGCRVAGSWFLPAEVHPSQGVGWVDNSWHYGRWQGGLPWYQGSITGSSSWHHDHFGGGGSDRGGNYWTSFSESRTFEVSLQPGGTSWNSAP
jgi:hypothetical protein